jgi:hypothetical protein
VPLLPKPSGFAFLKVAELLIHSVFKYYLFKRFSAISYSSCLLFPAIKSRHQYIFQSRKVREQVMILEDKTPAFHFAYQNVLYSTYLLCLYSLSETFQNLGCSCPIRCISVLLPEVCPKILILDILLKIIQS